MYEELVKRLRDISNSDSKIKSNYIGLTMLQAADAIEELSALVDASARDSAALLVRVEDLIPRWIPVAERLPESGELVIGYNGKRRFVAIVRVSRDSINLITHWMPLPNFPEPQKEETK